MISESYRSTIRRRININMGELISTARHALETAYGGMISRPYLRVFGHYVSQRFAIVGHARTGSNYLLDGLKSSKSIRAYSEIFGAHNREIGKGFDKILALLYQKQNRITSMVGFKLFYNHLTEEEWQKFLSYNEYKILHLTRNNRLRTIVSLDIAFKTGQWTRSTLKKEKKLHERQISLDVSNLMSRLEGIQNSESLTRERFKGRQIFEIVYEDLVQNPREKFHEVGDFLGVSDIDLNTIRIVKQNPEALAHLIINYDEVWHLLRNSRFAGYLDD